MTFPGIDPGVRFHSLSPRLGFTYDVSGQGKSIIRGNYAMYWGQVGVGGVASVVDPVTRVSIRYPWVDVNHDGFVQTNEISIPNNNIGSFLALTGNWNPAAPGSPTTVNSVDPNLKNDRTDEFILGVDHEIGLGFAVGANYIWRRYANFQFQDTLGLEPSDFDAVSFTPAASTYPGADGQRLLSRVRRARTAPALRQCSSTELATLDCRTTSTSISTSIDR